MDFKKILKLIIKQFEKQNINYAIIGGVALAIWKVYRATGDIDFLLLKEDFPKVEKILYSLSYKSIYKSENVAQFCSNSTIFGTIDFILAFRKYTRNMLKRAITKKIFNALTVKVLIPEDIIALKIQAFINDPERKNQDLADITALLKKYGKSLNWQLLKEYFLLFNLNKMFINFKEKYGN